MPDHGAAGRVYDKGPGAEVLRPPRTTANGQLPLAVIRELGFHHPITLLLGERIDNIAFTGVRSEE